jgi:hypothetical protein
MKEIFICTTTNTSYSVNKEQLFTSLKNNEVLEMNTSEYTDIQYYRELFKLLQINTSIKQLCIKYGNCNIDSRQSDTDNSEFYKLLSDYLRISIYLRELILVDYHITIKNSMLLNDVFKHNNTLNEIYLYYRNLDKDGCTHFIDSIKFNKTATVIGIDMNLINDNHIVELLKVNTRISSIYFLHEEVEKPETIKTIEKALKNNQYVTFLCVNFRSQNKYKKINTYCERNKHNLELKSMLIQDL